MGTVGLLVQQPQSGRGFDSASFREPRANTEHVTLATVSASLHEVCWSLKELVYKIILDIGCMRSVAGVHWANSLVTRWKEQGRW